MRRSAITGVGPKLVGAQARWWVELAVFDDIMLRKAAGRGWTSCEKAAVTGAVLDGGECTLVEQRQERGNRQCLRAQQGGNLPLGDEVIRCSPINSMMTGNFIILVNDDEQPGFWPVFADIPASWRVIFGEAGRAAYLDYRAAYLDYVEQKWTDILPKSL
jgi:uncharacterized protein YbdZ (MbtH family)